MTEAVTPSRSERISAALRDEILRGRYQTGDRLPSERELSERFEVHRSSVREALKRLEQLGLAQIRPGGARVAPIEQASLDVVSHLIDLEDPPELEVAGQVLEVFSGLFALAARLGVERASDAQREALGTILSRLASRDVPAASQHDLFHELAHLLVDASGNLVLNLVRRGLRTPAIEGLHHALRVLQPPRSLRIRLVRQLARAVTERNGAEAGEAMYQLTIAVRKVAIEALEADREARRPHSKTGGGR